MMKALKYVIYVIMILMLGSVLLTGCAEPVSEPVDTAVLDEDSEEETSYDLQWGTMTAGSAMQVLATPMLEDIKKDNSNITGSVLPSTIPSNVIGVHKGEFNIGFSLSDVTVMAWEGEAQFEEFGEIRDLRNLAALYPQIFTWAVWDDSDIYSVEDLRGKRVSPGSRGGSCDTGAQKLLQLYGMSYDDMNVEYGTFPDISQMMIDGHIDAYLLTACPTPFGPLIEVASHKQIRLLTIPDDKIAEMVKLKGVEPFTLPANIYQGVDYEVKGFATRAHIIVREDFPEDLAYKIVKSIAENFDKYPEVLKAMSYTSVEEMPSDVGIPLHPGAERYYREQNLID